MQVNESLTASFAGKTFLVTGGSGFIGSHISDNLLKMGARVMVVDDLSTGKRSNLLSDDVRLKLIQGDVKSYDFDSLGRVDGIFNEAARALIPSFKDPVEDLRVNTGGTIRLLEYSRKYDIKLIHASSGSVYGNPITIPITEEHSLNPISPYGSSKAASEIYCSMYYREYHLDVKMLRYFNVYGPRQSVSEEMGVIPIFVKRALDRRHLTIFGDGHQTRDFLNVDDVVKANLQAYVSDRGAGEAMNIGGGGDEISIRDLADFVMELCGFDAEPIYEKEKPGDIRRLVADNSKAKELIGYIPSVSLREGLQKYIDFARSS